MLPLLRRCLGRDSLPSFDSGHTCPPSRSALDRLTAGFESISLAASNWIISWTPPVLVTTFYIVSTAIFVMCNAQAIKVWYFFLMATNFYIAATCVIESFLSLTPIREARKAAMAVERNGRWPTEDQRLPTIDLVIVAYLPNEKDIIRDQVLYAIEELNYPSNRLRINLVYNTPQPIEPLESQLSALAEKIANLRIIKVPGSRSKADNLNYFLSHVEADRDLIGIFDTDHSPHPNNPRWAAERFLADGTVDIVQGRCVVHNTNESFQAKMIAIEFDKIYAISHPGRQRAFGFGLFCGSNGYWKADFLKAHGMNGNMLVEDIDSALRAYSKGKIAVHDMNVISYEMAPNNFGAFWKQRLRWAQGWTQASIKHLPSIWRSPQSVGGASHAKRSAVERFGLISLLFVREISYYLVTLHTCLVASFIITEWPHSVAGLVRLIFFRYPMAEWFFFATSVRLIPLLK